MRTVVEQPNFANDFDGYRRVYPELEDVYDKLTFALANNPLAGVPMREAPSFRIYETKPQGRAPAFWILYNFDTEHVYLHSVEPMRHVEE